MQEIIVSIIGIAVAAIVVVKIYKFFFTKNGIKGTCGCSDRKCGYSIDKNN